MNTHKRQQFHLQSHRKLDCGNLKMLSKTSSNLLVTLVIGLAQIGFADDTTTNDLVNLSSDKIARLREFKAENHYVTSSDGYIINVVYIPAVRKTNKRPVIFNHGSTQSSTYFMTNSVGARPRDYSDLDAGNMTKEELEQLLANEPVAKSLALLLSCFGHDIWLINRRGTEFSLGKTDPPGETNKVQTEATSGLSSLIDKVTGGLAGFARIWAPSRDPSDDHKREQEENTSSGLFGFLKLFLRPQLNLGSIPNTLDASYWNFSLDEQALYDLPAIILYVLEQTGSDKVTYVGHSLGNGVMFMLQSEHPEWADKVEPFLAFSPDFYLGHTTSLLRPLLVALQPINSAALYPFPPTPILPLTRTLLAALCQTKVAQESICRLLESAMWGSSEQQQNLPAFVASQFYAVSSHETVQLAQNTEKGKMYKYDYKSEAANMRAYNQSEAPIYNVSRITSKSISLWYGPKDILANEKDVAILKTDLKVSFDDRFIEESVNHYDLLFGKNVTTLVNIPSLKVIESYK